MKMQGEINLSDLIHLLKRGFRSNWSSVSAFSSSSSSSSGFRISVASLLGIAGLVFAFRDRDLGKLSTFNWSTRTQKSPQRLLLVPGLQNLGNNCFLNVILQALASCSFFQSFVQRVVDECESSPADENLLDSLPLAVALSTLLEELCVVGEGRVALSPRRVMLSMVNYIPSFNLTAQQDAAEAFLHLLSSLREEFSGCYDPSPSSLLELCSPSCRIISPKRDGDLSEPERWQQSFIGPFDGILGSILTCQSCSSQISLNFEAFHSLPLSPVTDLGSTLIPGCSLEDCLKQFTVAEQVENYRCINCWHIAGIKYLTSMGANETEIEKLRTCTKQDFCDCQRTYHQDIFQWSNKFSHTLKQISVARSPKILCIQLKRVLVNMFGELVKHQGHISFPIILDLFPFMTSGVAIRTQEQILQREQLQQHHQTPSFLTEDFSTVYERRKLYSFFNASREGFHSSDIQDLLVKTNLNETRGTYSERTCPEMEMQSAEQVATSSQLVSSSCLYQLVSVVEHFGRAGGGHYTVYRSARADSRENELANSANWFCISDSEVHRVSENEVLAAEASLLFYEQILEP